MKQTPQQLQNPMLHSPVLRHEVLKLLAPKKGESYLDLTAGYGGHAYAVVAITAAANLVTLVDRDIAAIEALEPLQSAGARIIHSDYQSAANNLLKEGKRFDMIL